MKEGEWWQRMQFVTAVLGALCWIVAILICICYKKMLLTLFYHHRKLEEFDLVKMIPTWAEAAPTLSPHVELVAHAISTREHKGRNSYDTTTNNVYSYYPHCTSGVDTSLCSMCVETVPIRVKCLKKLLPMVPSFNILPRYSKSRFICWNYTDFRSKKALGLISPKLNVILPYSKERAI